MHLFHIGTMKNKTLFVSVAEDDWDDHDWERYQKYPQTEWVHLYDDKWYKEHPPNEWIWCETAWRLWAARKVLQGNHHFRSLGLAGICIDFRSIYSPPTLWHLFRHVDVGDIKSRYYIMCRPVVNTNAANPDRPPDPLPI